ncbi:MAG: hypothetical protein ACHQNV_08255 [Vicinamibacteria bacterium]
MRILPLTSAIAVAALLLPTPTRAQSLTEAAAKEKERRKGKAAHTFTEQDLARASAGRTTDTAAAAPDAAGATADGAAAGAPKDGKEGAPKAKTPDELRADQEKAWRDRLTKATEDVTRLTGQIDTMQRSLNDVSQNLYGSSRTTQLARLEDAQKQLAAAQQAVTDLQEEGRRSSFR